MEEHVSGGLDSPALCQAHSQTAHLMAALPVHTAPAPALERGSGWQGPPELCSWQLVVPPSLHLWLPPAQLTLVPPNPRTFSRAPLSVMLLPRYHHHGAGVLQISAQRPQLPGRPWIAKGGESLTASLEETRKMGNTEDKRLQEDKAQPPSPTAVGTAGPCHVA